MDKVKPLKIENDGSQIDYLPTETNPNEDLLSCLGLSFKDSDTLHLYADSNNELFFKDAQHLTGLTYKRLRTAIDNIFNNNLYGFTSTNVQDAIYEAYLKAKGIKRYIIPLHYTKLNGLNQSFTNGTFWRLFPTLYASGSNSGYPAAATTQAPLPLSKLVSANLTFRRALFDYTTVLGPIKCDLEVSTHTYNGNSIKAVYTLSFGSFSGSTTPHDTHRYELTSANITKVSGTDNIAYSEMLGFRFVKSASGDRRINSFVDPVLTLLFEETT